MTTMERFLVAALFCLAIEVFVFLGALTGAFS